MKIGGKTKIKSSQVIETVEGDANLNIGIQAGEMKEFTETLISLKEENNFNDEELEGLVKDAKEGSIDEQTFSSRLKSFYQKLKMFYKMGTLIAEYGDGSIQFLKGLTNLLKR